jgi:hypothetical protein
VQAAVTTAPLPRLLCALLHLCSAATRRRRCCFELRGKGGWGGAAAAAAAPSLLLQVVGGGQAARRYPHASCRRTGGRDGGSGRLCGPWWQCELRHNGPSSDPRLERATSRLGLGPAERRPPPASRPRLDHRPQAQPGLAISGPGSLGLTIKEVRHSHTKPTVERTTIHSNSCTMHTAPNWCRRCELTPPRVCPLPRAIRRRHRLLMPGACGGLDPDSRIL